LLYDINAPDFDPKHYLNKIYSLEEKNIILKKYIFTTFRFIRKYSLLHYFKTTYKILKNKIKLKGRDNSTKMEYISTPYYI